MQKKEWWDKRKQVGRLKEESKKHKGKNIFELLIHQCERTRFYPYVFWSSLKHCINILENTGDMACPFRTGFKCYPNCCMFIFYMKQTYICTKSQYIYLREVKSLYKIEIFLLWSIIVTFCLCLMNMCYWLVCMYTSDSNLYNMYLSFRCDFF